MLRVRFVCGQLQSNHEQLLEATGRLIGIQRDTESKSFLDGERKVGDPTELVAKHEPSRRGIALQGRFAFVIERRGADHDNVIDLIADDGVHGFAAAKQHQHKTIGHDAAVRRLGPAIRLRDVELWELQHVIARGRRITPVRRFRLKRDPRGAIRAETFHKVLPCRFARIVIFRGAQGFPICHAERLLALRQEFLVRVDGDLIGKDSDPQLRVFKARFHTQRKQHGRKRIIPFLDELLRCALEEITDQPADCRTALANEFSLLLNLRALAVQFVGLIGIKHRLAVSTFIQNLVALRFLLQTLQGELTHARALQLLARTIARHTCAAEDIKCLAELAHALGWRSRFSSISFACTAIITGRW